MRYITVIYDILTFQLYGALNSYELISCWLCTVGQNDFLIEENGENTKILKQVKVYKNFDFL